MKKETKLIAISSVILLLVFAMAALFYKNKQSGEQAQKVQENSQALVRPHNITQGPDNAKVTIVEFLDPECEACRAMHPIVHKLLKEYPNDLRLVVRYMPFHSNSIYAAHILEIAREQGKFWEALDVMFEKQPSWGSHHAPKPELLKDYMKTLGVNLADLDNEMKKSAILKRIDLDKTDGMALGVQYTPSFFVNGKMTSDIGYDALKAAIEAALKN